MQKEKPDIFVLMIIAVSILFFGALFFEYLSGNLRISEDGIAISSPDPMLLHARLYGTFKEVSEATP
ncbi:hypothetical protein IPN35_02760 [Candidatus Peregrinibacteria bacterium]|nr:MAG: hypothetical protein IPN35_02760 [Candidatus Peregrinibacteria bacterium]